MNTEGTTGQRPRARSGSSARRDAPLSATADVAVLGAGMAGLAAADALATAGRRVTVLEAGEAVGGLARGLVVGGEAVEAYYHHVFPQDRELRSLIDRLGLGDRLEWLPASTAVLHEGRVYPFNGPLDVLRFSPLPVYARLRLGLGSALTLAFGRRRGFDRTSVGAAGPRWFGTRGYDGLWRPLLEAKFGPYASRVTMAWLAARMRQRAQARKRGTGDRLGYLRGSLGLLATRLAEDLRGRGVDIRCSDPVERLTQNGDRWEIAAASGTFSAHSVVACLDGDSLRHLAALPAPYLGALDSIPWRGVVCGLLELDRPIGRHYWVNLTDPLALNTLGIIEHTNLVPAERYGGTHLVYLAHYVDVDGPVWSASADDLVASAEPALRALNPAFERSWVRAVHVTRDRAAQPVPLPGGAMGSLPIETGLPGLFHASLAHIYPDDRGASLSLRLGAAAGRAADGWLDGRTPARGRREGTAKPARADA